MSGMAWALCALLGAGAVRAQLRQRRRSAALTVLPDERAPESADAYVLLVRRGVEVSDAVRERAVAHAIRGDLAVLDLIAPDLDPWRAVQTFALVDPATFRAQRTARGHSVGDALLVARECLARADSPWAEQRQVTVEAHELLTAARELRFYALSRSDLALAPTLSSAVLPWRARAAYAGVLGSSGLRVEAGLVLAALLWLTRTSTLAASLLALAAAALPLGLRVGRTLRPRGLAAYAIARPWVDAAIAIAARSPRNAGVHESSHRRAEYAALMREGTSRFFEPPRSDCPLCHASDLCTVLRSRDNLQEKPGIFTLSRCVRCGHVFQNPRLSIAGLEFYYRDAYDGEGAALFDDAFTSQAPSFAQRVDLVRARVSPASWLDVGAGHGHFCAYAAGVLPDTRFDGLDLNAGIEAAARRGFIREAHRGLFPEVAPRLLARGVRYDVVSMSHYLEHTLDPRAELAACRDVLHPEGLLMVELPDPESWVGRVFKSLWLPWLQPQHLHFLSVQNLERLLREGGFEPLAWQRGEAHMPHDFFFVAYFAVRRLAGRADHPWASPPGRWARARRVAVWTCCWPLPVLGWLCDQLSAPLMRRAGAANAFRVLARRSPTASREAAPEAPERADQGVPLPAAP